MTNYTIKFPLKPIAAEATDKLNNLRVRCGEFEDFVNRQIEKSYKQAINSLEYKEVTELYKKNKKLNKDIKEKDNKLPTKSLFSDFWLKKEFYVNYKTIKNGEQIIRSKSFRFVKPSKNGNIHSSPIADLSSNMSQSLIDGKYCFCQKGIKSKTAKQLGLGINLAWQKIIFGDGKKILYKNGEGVRSIPFVKNNEGFTGAKVEWTAIKDRKGKEISIPRFIIKYDDIKHKSVCLDIDYKRLNERDIKILEIIQNIDNIASFAVIHDVVRGKDKYYIAISVKNVYIEPKSNIIGKGKMGIDPGLENAYVYYTDSQNKPYLETFKLTPYKDKEEKKKVERKLSAIDKKMEASRRANNPDNYDENGKPKEKEEIKEWKDSKRYLKLKQQKQEIMRKFAAKRKIRHFEITKDIFSKANVINIEENNVKSMQKRKNGIRIKENGKIESNKNHGKAISNGAPANLINLLKLVGSLRGVKVNTISPYNSATQFDPILGEKSAQKLEEKDRLHTTIDGIVHHRDYLSAYNIYHNISQHLTEEEIKDYANRGRFDYLYDFKSLKDNYTDFCKIEKKELNGITKNNIE